MSSDPFGYTRRRMYYTPPTDPIDPGAAELWEQDIEPVELPCLACGQPCVKVVHEPNGLQGWTHVEDADHSPSLVMIRMDRGADGVFRASAIEEYKAAS